MTRLRIDGSSPTSLSRWMALAAWRIRPVHFSVLRYPRAEIQSTADGITTRLIPPAVSEIIRSSGSGRMGSTCQPTCSTTLQAEVTRTRRCTQECQPCRLFSSMRRYSISRCCPPMRACKLEHLRRARLTTSSQPGSTSTRSRFTSFTSIGTTYHFLLLPGRTFLQQDRAGLTRACQRQPHRRILLIHWEFARWRETSTRTSAAPSRFGRHIPCAELVTVLRHRAGIR